VKQQTRYAYEKRIEELKAENEKLRSYRLAALNIYDTVAELVGKDQKISMGWILSQFRSSGIFK